MHDFTLSAPPKVNLFLHVTGKRADGYHLLDSLVIFPQGLTDRLRFEASDAFTLHITGPTSQAIGTNEDNLVTRAVRSMEQTFGRVFTGRITLEKNIPAGAGLGGGSSDAAACIHGICRLWSIDGRHPSLHPLLTRLGADVPVCYHMQPSRFEGIGDIISPGPIMPEAQILIVCPPVHSSTAVVFGARSGAFYKERVTLPEKFMSAKDLATFLRETRNDLYDAAETLNPAIGKARTWMEGQPGCHLARMSGSGSSVFGLFDPESPLEESIAAAKAAGWWVAACTL